MERFISKTIEKLKLKEDNLLFEQLTRNSLFTVLSNMASTINMDIDKAELKNEKVFCNDFGYAYCAVSLWM